MSEYLIWFIGSALLGVLGVWLLKHLAIKMSWLDIPNKRSLHTQPTPRIGGIGILIPVLAGLAITNSMPQFALPWSVQAIVLLALGIALFSLADDFRNLPRWLRFSLHTLVGLIAILGLGEVWQGQALPLLGSGLPVIFCGFLLLLWLVGMTNAYNFMDGIDGIASIQGIVATVGWMTVCLYEPLFVTASPDGILLVLVVLCGGLVGFLTQNWSPARIFMGDSGSTFLGFLFAALPLGLAGMGLPFDRALEAGVFFVWPFVADSGWTFLRRLILREPVLEPHRSHLYQQLAASYSTRIVGHRIASLVYGLLSCIGIGLYWTSGPLWAKVVVLLWVWVAVFLWIHFLRGQPDGEPDASPEEEGYDIFLAPPEITQVEKERVLEALDSGYIAPVGPQVTEFEENLSARLGLDAIQVVNSGTAAIHLGLRALGVGPGDCVLCPDLTFIASVNPVRYLGAEPVLVDVDPANWAIDPQRAREAITSLRASGKTVRAMVVVHAYGIPAPMKALMELAREEEVQVLEDCAGAFGSSIGGKSVGSFGDAATWSFNGNKVLTTSGGGALYLKNPDNRALARSWANQGKDTAVGGYTHASLGYNYRLSNVSAAIGLGQLETVDQRLEKKVQVFDAYKNFLSARNGFSFMPSNPYGKNNYWLTCVSPGSQEKAAAILAALKKNRIEPASIWLPMHLQAPHIGLERFGGEVSEGIYREFISLPSGTQLSGGEIERICEIIESVV